MAEKNKITKITGRGIVHRGNQVDTDAIVPARYLKEVTFSNMGEYVFFDQRFDSQGKAGPHAFNEGAFEGARILFVNQNFGCGSSREHAPQALMRWGIQALVGESFAKIFSGNCGTLGMPAVTVDSSDVSYLMDLVEKEPKTEFALDLESRKISCDKRSFDLDMPASTLRALVDGNWNPTMMLKANQDLVRSVASKLPYTSMFRN